MEEKRARTTQQFAVLVEKLTLLSPLNTLLRGYSMAMKEDGVVVKSITQVEKDESLVVKLADGEIAVKVVGIK